MINELPGVTPDEYSFRKSLERILLGLGAYSAIVLVSTLFLATVIVISRRQIGRVAILLYLIPVLLLIAYSALTAKSTSGHIGYRLQLVAKRFLDVIGASIGLFCLGPLIIGIALAIKLGSPGPVLYRKQRIGQHGQRFDTYQFRTKSISPPDFPLTRIGRILRRYYLDTLPQLYNVLEGTMSLVGPWPRSPRLRNTLDEEKQILTFKPGLTGLWQISNAPEPPELDLHQATELELEYIKKWSLALDMNILLKTALAIFKGGNL
jgi:lipopolysaccharide/colanic/teichoic acid biosynthesis glycosyltransferase